MHCFGALLLPALNGASRISKADLDQLADSNGNMNNEQIKIKFYNDICNKASFSHR